MLTALASTAGTAVTKAGSPRISAAGLAFAADRKISAETLALLHVASGTTWFPDAEKKLEGLFFRYDQGWKARSLEGKHFVAEKGFKLAFWNLAAVLEASPAEVYIVEGELDACALVEAGVPADRVLSVPNGAKERPAESPQDQRGYDYVREALAAGLNRVKRFVWCGDADGPGHALRSDMAKILGTARFHFVDWPDGCKDANDYLKSDGPDALRELVSEGALPWPVAGIYRLSVIPEPAPLKTWNPGFPEWESKVHLAPATMSVVTGHPGHGKTMMFTQIWFQIVKNYDLSIGVCSFETRAKPHLRRILRTLYNGKLEKEQSEEELRKADRWIEDRYCFFIHPEQRPTLEWYLDMAEVAVIRYGAKIIQIDPWNRLEEQRGRDESKTDYIGRCLRTIHAFAQDMNVHMQILAHPAKMDGTRRGTPPSLEDISDSKNWDNMVDQGFVVHRPAVFEDGVRKTEAELFQRKARFEELGYPCTLKMNFDIAKGRYVSTDYQVGGY